MNHAHTDVDLDAPRSVTAQANRSDLSLDVDPPSHERFVPIHERAQRSGGWCDADGCDEPSRGRKTEHERQRGEDSKGA